jgi:glycosyltransferase involved in cell wall biosynthesis
LSAHGDTPALSVVVIVFDGGRHLGPCLDGLVRQTGALPEIIVAFDSALRLPAGLLERYPDVRLLPVPAAPTPAQLRAQAVALARARVVALLEDHCVPEPDWCERILAAHEGPHAAVGGCVEKGFAPGAHRDSALNWAIYLTDYSRYMPPLAAGPAASLTDCNVSYRRAELERIRDAWTIEFHENVVHERLRALGATLWLDPSIIVREHRDLRLADALRDRYAFGRLFASTRVAQAPLARRSLYAAASALLPPVLVWRAARNLLARRRHLAQLPRCLPALFLVSSAWMLGELVGYATATPAASLRARGREVVA